PKGYTETFMIRFPVLYFCDMGMSMLLSLQKQHYYLKAADQAHMDVLTGLSNRNMYIEYIDQLAEKPLNEDLIVIALDLNCLKINNDTLGHEAGDEMLTGTAECMRTAFDGAELLCRSGGDEFIVITFKPVKVVQAQIAHFRSLTVAHQGKLVNELTVSLGMSALRDHPGASIPELVKFADDMLYEEKEAFYRSAGLERRHRG
ncbi:MAG: hypothetical protein CW338_11880, partial [Clostridiales bacterium]|nr:hypothetical protein [Clostridiales bacterium]